MDDIGKCKTLRRRQTWRYRKMQES